MREILFRGKRIANGKWVSGYYVVRKRPYFKDKGADLEHIIYNNLRTHSDEFVAMVEPVLKQILRNHAPALGER